VEPGYAADQGQKWLPVALVAMALCVIPHPRLLGLITYPMLIASLAVLVVMPFLPTAIVPEINGARAWIRIAGMSVQPSELTRIFFVLALARYLRFRDSYRTLSGLLVPFLIMFI